MAENEVAHAGIGVDVGVNGLDSLIKTNSFMEKLRRNAEKLHNISSTITTHVNNASELSKLKDQLDGIRKGVKANVSVDANGFARAQQRVNHLDDSVTQIRHNVSSVGRTSSSSFNEMGDHAENARTKALSLSDAGKKIHGVFSGTFIGNAASQTFSSISSGAKSAISSGIKLAESGDEVRESWQHIGIGNNGANEMVNQMDQLRDKAGLDEQTIEQLQRRFYVLTGSAGRARSLTNEIAAFGKASGESSREIGRMGRTLPRLLSTSKVRATMFNRTLGQDPALFNAIIKASGKSKKSFQQLVNSGKLTSQQLQQYMNKAAKGSSHAWAQYDRTFKGQMQTIRGSVTEAKESFAKPFVNQLTKSLNQTERSGTGLQKMQVEVGKLSSELGKKVGDFAGKAIGYIVKNQKPLGQILKSVTKIVAEFGKGIWKAFSGTIIHISHAFDDMTGKSHKSGNGIKTLSQALSHLASHTKAIRALGEAFAFTFAAWKFYKAAKGIHAIYSSLKEAINGIKNANKFQKMWNKLQKGYSSSVKGIKKVWQWLRKLNSTQKIQNALTKAWTTMQKAWAAIVGPIKAFWAAEKAGVGIQTALDAAMDANPIGAIIIAITAAVGAIVGLVAGLRALYKHCAPARHAMQAIGRVGVAAFKAITFPERMVLKFLGGIVKGVWHATSGLRHKLGHALSDVGHHVKSFYHSATHNASKWGHEAGQAVGSVVNKFTGGQKKEARASERTHKKIDRYRKNSSSKFRAYISKNGKIYSKYHKGCTRISKTTYRQREAIRKRYYAKYEANLKKYEHNYRKYEDKRASLSRKYGKLRAMYSEKSLKTIEARFKGLKNTVVRYAKMMFKDTQQWFRKLGTGAGKQFKDIYRTVRKYLRMSNREATKDFKQLAKISTKWLDGSVNKYIKELRRRFKSQRYYDAQLIKQSKKTGQAMYKLPLGWIGKETKDLIRNWQRQRKSFITHNERMTKAERTHLHTMTNHLESFGDNFSKMMNDLEKGIYDKWSSFWTKMYDRAGSGINSVQRPLNSGAEHINSFVRAFGETTSPMHEMPSVSYATGTGFRRPITHMVQATLNDGKDSPETNEQETVIRPNGSVEFPQGQNVKETLEPGTEVLNATETKLMGEMAHFAPTVHFASGTGLFGSLFDKMSSWIKSALDGSNDGMSYDSVYSQAKGSGYHKLLHVLQKVLSHNTQILSGFMGNAPQSYHGALNDIVKGIYGQTSTQIDAWWKALMNLTNQALNDGGSSSAMLNYAIKNFSGIPYSMGGMSKAAADCSGAVDMIARHFGVNLPRTTTGMESDPSQLQYLGKSESRARAGDLVLFGHGNGAAGHVGIYTGHPDLMWNETPPHSRISKISDAESAVSLAGFYRLKKMSQDNNQGPSFKGASKGLMAFVKKQEAPMFKWIAKHLAPLLNPDPGGGPGVAKWRPIIEDAARKMGVHLTDTGLHKVLSNIAHESNGDEHVTQHISDINSAEGHPAQGLLQFIPSTFAHYAVSGHDDIKNGFDQLLALFNDSSWYSDIAPGGGWGPTGSRRMQSGGHIKAGELATVGEKGEELFKPDTSGTIIPHSTTKRILNNNNQNPIYIKQNITVNANGNKANIKRDVQSGMEHSTENLMQKLNRLSGNTKGGLLV